MSSSPDRKSTRLNSSHGSISYAVFCLKKKTHHREQLRILDTTRAFLGAPSARLTVSLRGGHTMGRCCFFWSLRVLSSVFFFFNEGAPPEISPFPPRHAFPI